MVCVFIAVTKQENKMHDIVFHSAWKIACVKDRIPRRNEHDINLFDLIRWCHAVVRLFMNVGGLTDIMHASFASRNHITIN